MNKKSAALKLIVFATAIAMIVLFVWTGFYPTSENITPPSSATAIRGNPAFAEPNLIPVDEMLKTASIDRGRGLTHICNDCHSFDEGGPNRLGPNLYGIYEGKHALAKNYAYSPDLLAMRDKIWTAENLNKWLMGPRVYAPGTKMVYPGLSKAQDRADVIAYMKSLK